MRSNALPWRVPEAPIVAGSGTSRRAILLIRSCTYYLITMCVRWRRLVYRGGVGWHLAERVFRFHLPDTADEGRPRPVGVTR